jgi:hypothetical protein
MDSHDFKITSHLYVPNKPYIWFIINIFMVYAEGQKKAANSGKETILKASF